MGLRKHMAALEAELAYYRDGINWGTSCLNCASVLTSSYESYVRAERAEAALTEAQSLNADLADVLSRMVVGWDEIIGADLAWRPDVVRVMARYREQKGAK